MVFKIKNLIRNILSVVYLFLIFAPLIGMAQPSTNVNAPGVYDYYLKAGDFDTFFKRLDTAQPFTVSSAWERIGIIVNWVSALLGVAALVFLLYGAYMYMSAGQNDDHLKKAKAAVTYGIIGAVVAVLAFSIFSFASSLVS